MLKEKTKKPTIAALFLPYSKKQTYQYGKQWYYDNTKNAGSSRHNKNMQQEIVQDFIILPKFNDSYQNYLGLNKDTDYQKYIRCPWANSDEIVHEK